MKIKVVEKPYAEVALMEPAKHKKPVKSSKALRTLVKVLSKGELKAVNFKCEKIGMEKLAPGQPALVLMNHSSFIDLKIASTLLYPYSFHIVCTSDGFVGKDGIMRHLGCIPTKKFMMDLNLVKDMQYATNELKSSVLLYPEASYSFDGTATPLPESLGKCLKLLKVPVIMIRTYGAFTRDPLYNSLQLRDVAVSATMEYLFSPEDIAEKSVKELNDILKEHFTFDHFQWQMDNHICVDEPFRADDLNRVLYKCSSCGTEGKMLGKGTGIGCQACGSKWELTEYGALRQMEGEKSNITHIPDWYRWEREQVRAEIENDTYEMNLEVDIYMMIDAKCIYKVGDGRLRHSRDGFELTGCDGQLSVQVKPKASYSVYSDYFWYEIGDMICIGDSKALYYCFPKDAKDVVAKARLATEELYKYVMA